MLEALAERPVAARALAAAIFALALAAFALPFVSVTADRRQGEATGFELVAGEERFSGTYVHEAFRGEVEHWTRLGEAPAIFALASIVAALVLVWLPFRIGPAAALGFGVLALFAFNAFYSRVGSSFAFADTDRRSGFGFSLVLTLVATVWAGYLFARTPFWWKMDSSGRRDYFA